MVIQQTGLVFVTTMLLKKTLNNTSHTNGLINFSAARCTKIALASPILWSDSKPQFCEDFIVSQYKFTLYHYMSLMIGPVLLDIFFIKLLSLLFVYDNYETKLFQNFYC
mmetsp:Transcript_18369/g.42035  ORF Transcript_18369/g.42035 Transcript_18369/m.42035 type:complete len:109 (+) Transcript_18369:363-689(+)